MNILDFLYATSDRDSAPFLDHWIGPQAFTHGEQTTVAIYAPTNDDGSTVMVFCTAMPARFYTLDVVDRDGLLKYRVTTGSGQAALVATLSKEISSGMLGIEPS